MATRKLADPRWDAPRDALLEFEVYTTEKDDTLTVELKTDTWRNYTGRKAETWTALIPLENQGRNLIALSHDDFQNLSGQVLGDWFGITELILQPGSKSQLPITKECLHGQVRFPCSLTCDGQVVKLHRDLSPIFGSKPISSTDS